MARNEDRQMEMLLEEGGIADDGMRVDPVSGNEIPPGSMASEVRDDVPAQLSEGEYVVPADVLRFYGVKFFEDLRAEAKMGLAGMEADGRIGGEPVPAGGPQMGGGGGEDLTPEEMAVLQEMGMAVGGMVPQPTQSTSPYMQQQQLYQQPSPVAMGNVGYDEGGLEDGSNVDPYTAQFTGQTSAAFGPGFLIDQTLGKLPTTGSDIKTVTMYGPNGEVETLTLPAQQARYDELLSMSYSETPVATTTETTVGEEEIDQSDGPGFDPNDPTGPQAQNATGDPNTAEGILGNIAENVSEFGLNAVAAAINSSAGPVGLAVQAITGTTISDIIGLTDPDNDSTGLGQSISDALGLAPGGLFGDVDNDGIPNVVDFNDGYGPVDKDKGTGSTSTTSTSNTPTSSIAAQAAAEAEVGLEAFGGTGADVSNSPQGPTAAQSAQAEAEAEIGLEAFGGTGDPAPSASTSGTGTGVSPTGDDVAGTPFNEGGLASRPKKKK